MPSIGQRIAERKSQSLTSRVAAAILCSVSVCHTIALTAAGCFGWRPRPSQAQSHSPTAALAPGHGFARLRGRTSAQDPHRLHAKRCSPPSPSNAWIWWPVLGGNLLMKWRCGWHSGGGDRALSARQLAHLSWPRCWVHRCSSISVGCGSAGLDTLRPRTFGLEPVVPRRSGAPDQSMVSVSPSAQNARAADAWRRNLV